VTAVTLRAAEREVVVEEAAAVLAAARGEEARAELAELHAAAQAGDVPEALQPLLERIVGLGLQTGRIRALYGPGGEQAALRVHRRLPEGAEGAERARAVTEALAALRGRELESIRISAAGPGAFTLEVRAGGMELSVRLDRQGARLRSVAA
jgi:hypothetical protein